jgi:hypothetical protein
VSQYPPENNPYAYGTSPVYDPNQYGQQQYTPGNDSILTQLKALGIIFIVLAVLGILGGIYVIVSNIIVLANGGMPIDENIEPQARQIMELTVPISIVVGVISIFAQIFILLAGINMLRLRGRTMIIVGAIVASIPFMTPCCVTGMPFGIWALIVMNDPRAKQMIQ